MRTNPALNLYYQTYEREDIFYTGVITDKFMMMANMNSIENYKNKIPKLNPGYFSNITLTDYLFQNSFESKFLISNSEYFCDDYDTGYDKNEIIVSARLLFEKDNIIYSYNVYKFALPFFVFDIISDVNFKIELKSYSYSNNYERGSVQYQRLYSSMLWDLKRSGVLALKQEYIDVRRNDEW